jgi:hypothetical protein
MAKTKSVDVSENQSGTQVNFGNVEALKIHMANETNVNIRAVKDLLVKIDATLIRMEQKYDANQNNQPNGGN